MNYDEFTKKKKQGRLFEIRLTLFPDYRLPKGFISLIKYLLKANFKQVIKKILSKNLLKESALTSN